MCAVQGGTENHGFCVAGKQNPEEFLEQLTRAGLT